VFFFMRHQGVVLDLSYGFGNKACITGDAIFASLRLCHN
jgi:hypothetical protein